MGRAGNAGIDFRTGFLAAFGRSALTFSDHQETARFPGGLCCGGTADHFVSMIARRDLRSRVRLNERALILRKRASGTPAVSANVRRKSVLIARRAVHHCASLHIAGLPAKRKNPAHAVWLKANGRVPTEPNAVQRAIMPALGLLGAPRRSPGRGWVSPAGSAGSGCRCTRGRR